MATDTVEPPSRTRRRHPPPNRVPIWRRARRVLLFACLFCLGVAALSWLPGVSGSRNLSLSIASVEWLRSHGGNPIVTQIENWYYQLNEPEKGVCTPGTAEPPEPLEDRGSGEVPPGMRKRLVATVRPFCHPPSPLNSLIDDPSAQASIVDEPRERTSAI